MTRSLQGGAQALGLVGAFLIFGCGPNVQLIYEGNVRFEHCYRLDLDPSIAPPHRKACWKDYLARHTYAQTGDRLSYAQQRLNELEQGQQAALVLTLDAGLARVSQADALPMPSSIHAAPPARAPEPTPVASQAPPAPSNKIPTPPDADCSNACVSVWKDCSPKCDGTESAPAAKGQTASKPPMGITVPSNQRNRKDGCADCRKTFKVCMQRCYR